MHFAALGLAGLFVLTIGFVEIDWDMGFEGHLSSELRVWAVAHTVALVLAARFSLFRYLVMTWALYVGMNYSLWTYLSGGGDEGRIAELPVFWYVLGVWSVLGLIASLVADTAVNSLGPK
jgi:hypothetical protein